MLKRNNQNNLITVGIPFYLNTNPIYMEKSLLSIINQSLVPNQIHLIQDGDIPDDLASIIKSYKDKYPNLIKLICLPKKGLPYALNQSIFQTETKYYARMDSDDIAFSHRLEKQINYLEKNIDIDILGTWSIEFEDEENKENGLINKRPSLYNKVKDSFHYSSAFIHPTVMFRMSVFDKIGYYNERFFTAQDVELCARAFKKNIKISNLQESLLYYRTQGMQERRSDIKAIKRQIIAKYSYNTKSVRLNILKILSILFRFLPSKLRLWSYKYLR